MSLGVFSLNHMERLMRRSFILALPVLALLATALVAGEGRQEKPDQTSSGQADKAAGSKAVSGFDVDAFIKAHDKNKDGYLSKDELPERFRSYFDQLDANHDGKLSREELVRGLVYTQARPRPSDLVFLLVEASDCDEGCAEELQIMYSFLHQLDTNKNVTIDPEELKVARKKLIDRRVDAIFRDLDTNKDGKISRAEARGQVKRHFEELDTNKDGSIDRDELWEAAAAKPPVLPPRTGVKLQPKTK